MAIIESLFEGSFGILQVIGLIISIFLISKTIIDFRKEKLGKGIFIFWIMVWVAALVTFSIPKAIQSVFSLLETGNVFVIALIITNIVLFVLVYILFTKQYSLNKKIKSLVQKLALKEKITTDEDEND